jgi:hypothetical protein
MEGGRKVARLWKPDSKATERLHYLLIGTQIIKTHFAPSFHLNHEALPQTFAPPLKVEPYESSWIRLVTSCKRVLEYSVQ